MPDETPACTQHTTSLRVDVMPSISPISRELPNHMLIENNSGSGKDGGVVRAHHDKT